jgi:hypothetical protein
MNLKLVAVSMSVLGLIASPVFADTMHKHKHARKHYDQQDYKGSGSMPLAASSLADLTSPMESASLSTVMLSDMQQNSNLSKPHADWFNHFAINGSMEFGTAFGSLHNSNDAYLEKAQLDQYSIGYYGENSFRFSNRFDINVTAKINDWANALVVINAQRNAPLYNISEKVIDAVYTSKWGGDNTVNVEQAFIHFGNFEKTPFFVEVGKQFVDYGRYDTHALTQSLSQVLTQSLVSAVKLGYINDMGISGSVYTFQNNQDFYMRSPVLRAQDVNKDPTMNYGASVNYYSHLNDQISYKLGASYLYDMMGVDAIHSAVEDGQLMWRGYNKRVGGLAVYADMSYDAFTLGANYTSAIRHFAAADLAKDSGNTTQGARPWALGLQAGYDFNAWSKNNNVYVGYQSSRDTIYANLPKSRYLVGYSIDVLKNTKLSAEWDHDNAWNYATQGGSQNGDSNLIALRAAVKFG